MVKEKNILILIALLVSSLSWGQTVCTTYEGKRLCGNSLIVQSERSKLTECKKDLPSCKKLVITNSHLTSGTKVEICDADWKCTEVKRKNVLNDVVNDVAVFEIPQSSHFKANGKLTSKGAAVADFVVNPDMNSVSVSSPRWLPSDMRFMVEKGTWENDQVGLGTFVVEKGMSGSPVSKGQIDFSTGEVNNELLGLVTGHHNFIPVSNYVKKEHVLALGNSYLKGERGQDKKSKDLGAKWHYSAEGKTTFRSLKDGTLWETGTLSTPTGGGTGTDTGGGTGTDTGGGTGTDTGGGTGTDTGGGTGTDTGGGTGTDTGGGTGTDTGNACGTNVPLNIKFFKDMNKFYGLYHGVIIRDRKVIGFKEKKTGRIVHANWELLSLDDIAQEKYQDYEPYYEDDLNLKDLLHSNRPDLMTRKSWMYCNEGTSDCAIVKIDGDKMKIYGSGSEVVVVDLDMKKSASIFKNIPVTYASGKKSSIWLADIFLPDARLDGIRKSETSIVGGNHKTGKLEVLKTKEVMPKN